MFFNYRQIGRRRGRGRYVLQRRPHFFFDEMARLCGGRLKHPRIEETCYRADVASCLARRQLDDGVVRRRGDVRDVRHPIGGFGRAAAPAPDLLDTILKR